MEKRLLMLKRKKATRLRRPYYLRKKSSVIYKPCLKLPRITTYDLVFDLLGRKMDR